MIITYSEGYYNPSPLQYKRYWLFKHRKFMKLKKNYTFSV